MISKHISAVCAKKIQDWANSIPSTQPAVKQHILRDTFITGGALVSLIQGEKVNDFDVYFRSAEAAFRVAEYYVSAYKLNRAAQAKKCPAMEVQAVRKKHVQGERTDYDMWEVVELSLCERVRVFVSSQGIEEEAEPSLEEITGASAKDVDVAEEETVSEEARYRPIFFSSNAITLSNKIQLITRFFGEPEEVHKNYDFVHCKGIYQSWDGAVHFSAATLEAIINKVLVYTGSKYPLCSIIRARKFITRGWTINAGQYLKMVLQLQEINLLNMANFEEQLTGVDSAYFNSAIEHLRVKQRDDADFKITVPYLIEIIDRIF